MIRTDSVMSWRSSRPSQTLSIGQRPMSCSMRWFSRRIPNSRRNGIELGGVSSVRECGASEGPVGYIPCEEIELWVELATDALEQ